MNTFSAYANYGGDSGVVAYKVEGDAIHVQFKHGGTYVYRLSDIGDESFAELIRLAESGEGLNSYINRHREVAKGWSEKY